MINVAASTLPITSAYTGQSCTNCSQTPTNHNNATKNNKLLRCTSCKLANYCSRECQRKDWPKHKVECKILQLYRHSYNDMPGKNEYDRITKAHRFLEIIPMMLQSKEVNAAIVPVALPSFAQYNKSFTKEGFLKFAMGGRACSICLKNEFSVSSDDDDDDNNNRLEWTCCPKCRFGWCCSKDHWDQYYQENRHTPEICESYKTAIEVNLFHYNHMTRYDEVFLHLPKQTLPSTLKTFPKTWEEYFSLRFVTDIDNYQATRSHLPKAFYPAATRFLSPPVTCLSAMYKYGIEHFQNLNHFHLHIVGADFGYELQAISIWEEILHCLPKVKDITIQFVGPEAYPELMSSGTANREIPTFPTENCSDCEGKKRKRFQGMFGYTYHEYVKRYLVTKKHKAPHFIVAFNTGMHEVDKASWKTSLQTILDLDVPAYFTSYTESEAVQDFAVLKSSGANILQNEPSQNEFREDYMTIEAASEGRVDQFYACNMYGVLFKGRMK